MMNTSKLHTILVILSYYNFVFINLFNLLHNAFKMGHVREIEYLVYRQIGKRIDSPNYLFTSEAFL